MFLTVICVEWLFHRRDIDLLTNDDLDSTPEGTGSALGSNPHSSNRYRSPLEANHWRLSCTTVNTNRAYATDSRKWWRPSHLTLATRTILVSCSFRKHRAPLGGDSYPEINEIVWRFYLTEEGPKPQMWKKKSTFHVAGKMNSTNNEPKQFCAF